jgi:5S rRNA maturation endonuclease (ribonuclease M5)
MLYSTKPKITLEYINSYVSDYDIYCYYLGYKFIIGKVFNSPLREDNTPSFGIIQKNNGALIFNDFARNMSGDVVKFVQLLKNLNTRKEALELIHKDLILQGNRASSEMLKVTFQPIKKATKKIGVVRQPFTSTDLNYWLKFNITEEILKFYEVASAKYVLTEDIVSWVYTTENPCYVYKVYDKLKTYRPLAHKNEKWLGSLTKNYILGYKQLPETGDLLIITKSLKDVMVLYSLGYTAISSSSEGVLLPISVMEDLQKRFKHIILLYDNDIAGKEYANKILKAFPGIKKQIELPIDKAKDIAEYIFKYTKEETKIILKKLCGI